MQSHLFYLFVSARALLNTKHPCEMGCSSSRSSVRVQSTSSGLLGARKGRSLGSVRPNISQSRRSEEGRGGEGEGVMDPLWLDTESKTGNAWTKGPTNDTMGIFFLPPFLHPWWSSHLVFRIFFHPTLRHPVCSHSRDSSFPFPPWLPPCPPHLVVF